MNACVSSSRLYFVFLFHLRSSRERGQACSQRKPEGHLPMSHFKILGEVEPGAVVQRLEREEVGVITLLDLPLGSEIQKLQLALLPEPLSLRCRTHLFMQTGLVFGYVLETNRTNHQTEEVARVLPAIYEYIVSKSEISAPT